MICLFLFFVLFALLVLYVLQEESICKEIQNIPGPPLVPFFRSQAEIDLYMKGVLNNIDKLTKEYGSVVRLCAGSKVIVLLTEPKYIELLLKCEGINCKEDFNECTFAVEKLVSWLKSKLGPFSQILSLNNSVLVDSEFFSYFTQEDANINTHRNGLTLCLFKAEKILKSVDEKSWQDLVGRMPELIMERSHSTNSIVRFLAISALVILAKRPDVQHKASDEIDRIFGSKGKVVEINLQNARNAKCLDGVLKRIIRSHTAVNFIVKTLTKKIKFGDISVPAGVNVVIFTSGASLPNPPKQPDYNGNVKENSCLHTSPKRCVAQKRVILRTQLVLIKIIRNFEVIQEENGASFKLKPR